MFLTNTERSRALRVALTDAHEILKTRRVKRDILVSKFQDLTSEIDSLRLDTDNLKLIEAYLMQFADERQALVFQQIEAVVTEGLRTIFQEDLRFDVDTKQVGSRSEVVFSIISETESGELKTSVMESRGGGVSSVCGFLVQAVLILLTPGMRPFMALDETLRAVSEEYQAPLGQFIADLCERTGLQVLLVSHQPTISEHADVCYSFSQIDGITHIKGDL